jgi:hypothetical protein
MPDVVERTSRIMKLPLPDYDGSDEEIVSQDFSVPGNDHLSCSDNYSNLEISVKDVCDQLSDNMQSMHLFK